MNDDKLKNTPVAPTTPSAPPMSSVSSVSPRPSASSAPPTPPTSQTENLGNAKQAVPVNIPKTSPSTANKKYFSEGKKVNQLPPGALETKEILDKKPKVMISLPLSPGEKQGKAVEYVSINGYPYHVMKGVYVSVPEPVAKLLMNHYNIVFGDSELGRQKRVNRDEDTEKALS